MKKKYIVITVLSLLTVIIVLGIYVLSDYSRILNENWGFVLPKQAKCREIYNNCNDVNINGGGVRYRIYSYKNEEYIESMFDWTKAQNKTTFNITYEQASNEWMNKIGVPDEKRPDFASCKYTYYSKADNSEIVILWDDITDKLYIIENFI